MEQLLAVMRIALGAVVAAVLLVGGALVWRHRAPCLDRCGAGTECAAGLCVATLPPPAMPVDKAPTRKRRGSRGGGNGGNGGANGNGNGANGGDSAAAPEVVLHPGDEKMVAQGDALGRPEHIDLSKPDQPGIKELQQEDLDRVFLPSQPAITRCITSALGDAPLETGRVEVGLRVEGNGQVRRVRVEAPSLLQRNGLTRCVRGVVTALRFPSSGGASVVTYPFELK